MQVVVVVFLLLVSKVELKCSTALLSGSKQSVNLYFIIATTLLSSFCHESVLIHLKHRYLVSRNCRNIRVMRRMQQQQQFHFAILARTLGANGTIELVEYILIWTITCCYYRIFVLAPRRPVH